MKEVVPVHNEDKWLSGTTPAQKTECANFVAQMAAERWVLNAEVPLDENVVALAKVLNQSLMILDELGLSQAATHLSAAIEALPGQAALLPIDLLDLLN